MNKKAVSQDSHFTSQVRVLIDRLSGRSSENDTVLENAIHFYATAEENEQIIAEHQETQLQRKAKIAGTRSNEQKKIQLAFDKAEREHREFLDEKQYASNMRHKLLREMCYRIIDLSEGETLEESNRKSAQLLGTIQLISPTEGARVAEVNERHKALYKAVLCLRLLDKLIIDGKLNDGYVIGHLKAIDIQDYPNFKTVNEKAYNEFVEDVKVAILMAALVQDIGNHHPDALDILYGKNNKADPYRTLEIEDRKKLLQINYRETNRYLVDGVGPLMYLGNSKEDKIRFDKAEQAKIVFVRQLLKAAIKPQQGIGNLLKVPQIYTSIILSTKGNYNYKVLPKVYNVLDMNADRGACLPSVVDALKEITGIFPQGYGITYIPKASDGTFLDFYEYAVVCQLYPSNPNEPVCRQATRSLTFIGHGQDITIKADCNLHFAPVAKRLLNISKSRLEEILEKLVSNIEERKEMDIIPRCWMPNNYFSIKTNQKLWNKSVN